MLYRRLYCSGNGIEGIISNSPLLSYPKAVWNELLAMDTQCGGGEFWNLRTNQGRHMWCASWCFIASVLHASAVIMITYKTRIVGCPFINYGRASKILQKDRYGVHILEGELRDRVHFPTVFHWEILSTSFSDEDDSFVNFMYYELLEHIPRPTRRGWYSNPFLCRPQRI